MDGISSKLQEVFDVELSSYRKLHELLSGVSDSQARWRPIENQWSIGELAHHLSLSQGRILRAMEMALRGAEERNLGPDRNTESAVHSLDFASERTRGNLLAASHLTPQHGRDLKVTLQEINAQQASLERMLCRLSRRDLHQLRFPHLFLGELDLYQWILFWGGHASRHRKQMEAIRRLPAFQSLGGASTGAADSTST